VRSLLPLLLAFTPALIPALGCAGFLGYDAGHPFDVEPDAGPTADDAATAADTRLPSWLAPLIPDASAGASDPDALPLDSGPTLEDTNPVLADTNSASDSDSSASLAPVCTTLEYCIQIEPGGTCEPAGVHAPTVPAFDCTCAGLAAVLQNTLACAGSPVRMNWACMPTGEAPLTCCGAGCCTGAGCWP
jgi:hypothetical protein